MGIPYFQKLDKWEDNVKFAVSVRVLRLKMNSKLKKNLNIYILNDRYINIYSWNIITISSLQI